ncbi:biopolymer transporter ExbD [candidate division KSB1 bacterium]|nr:biopolymer transporter ExbD [candidate division KSB1 bacterium]
MFSKGGLIIRLIDVVLILLLGFIGISDFTVKTQIKLPTGGNESPAIVKRQVLTIRVNSDTEFQLSCGDTFWPLITKISDVDALIQRVRDDWRAQGMDMMVIIYPDENTMIQTTVDLIDLCEMNGIPKSIHYEI